MSKLAKAIQALQTGEVRAKKDFKFTEIQHRNQLSPQYLYREYKIEAKFGVNVYVEEETISDALKDAKLAIIEEIFGEFRPILTEMRVALYNTDLTRARNLLSQLEMQMFTELE